MINGKLELLEQKEKLMDKSKNVNGNKRKLDCSLELKKSKNKKQKLSLPYDCCFDLDEHLEERKTFSPTAVVRVKVGSEFVKVRAFLDTGAQPNLASFSFYHRHLSDTLSSSAMTRKIIGINGEPFAIKRKILLSIHSWYDDALSVNGIFWIMPKESKWSPHMPDHQMNPFKIKNTTEMPFADPNYWKPEQVHLLFGVGIFARIITAVADRPMAGTVLMDTTLGIIVFGEDLDENMDENGHALSAIEYKEEIQLDNLLERLWQQDQVPTVRKLSKEEMEVEEHYANNFKRDKNGRFIVKMPLKADIMDLGDSREIARRRFLYLEKKLAIYPETRDIYVEKMRESIKLGHLAVATEAPRPGEMVYYIPHHRIPKDNRIVFDASCKTDKGISLNDMQMIGPKLQKDLFETIMRFRRHRTAVYADIKKMFNQVKMDKSQWNLQRIFWREHPNEPLMEYWWTVVIFGQASSAYLAVKSVMQAARESSEFPKAAKAIEEDFYMDDCVTEDDSEEAAIKLAMEIDCILKSAGFELRKWKSNSKSVVSALETDMEKAMLFEAEDNSTVLGLKWLIDEDKFTFTVKNPQLEGKVTKRTIVSHVAQLYDPNGYISPVTVRGKILAQDLWKAKADWDDELDETFVNRWTEFWKDIKCLEKFKIDRWLATGKEVSVQMHGFSDAASTAYGANVYVRTQDLKGNVTCNLLTTKSRVAPVKTVSIPRLELSAAELLARLMQAVLRIMEWPTVEYFLWIDSSVAYHRIRKEPYTLKTFVANRVASIQDRTVTDRWRHIDGKDNPADLLTRGVSPSELIDCDLWLHGPDWIRLPPSEWPVTSVMSESPAEVMAEVTVNIAVVVNDPLQIRMGKTKKTVSLLEYTGKLEKLVNILCYVKRFIKLWIKKTKVTRQRKRRGEIVPEIMPPTNEEKTEAMICLIRKSQQMHFKAESNALSNNRPLPEKSKLEAMDPKMDNMGLLRLGGRLDRSELDYEMKHPFIIPHDSQLAQLIMNYAHRQTHHGGVQVMTQFIRQKYWISRLRNGLRNIVHKCVVCVRMNARMETQLMSELPKERVQVGKPFLHTGVDYAGPFELRMPGESDDRQRKKCWIAIFVCLKTRAIHIDIVSDLTSVAFIACYERFIARRGRCRKLFSDNGTSFKGAEKEIKKAMEHWIGKDMLEHMHNRGTDWEFMSPAAPHQGGIYEAAVKSMKFHVKRIMGMKILPYEQFYTLLLQVEAILNSRPINPLSDDPKDMQALTPGHFLVGEPLVTPLPFVIDPKPTTVGVRLWKDRQRMVQHFWERWKNEYLTTLQERKKWRKEKESLEIGQLVVLRSENFPPASWALGRICELLRSKDGLVRNVIVETATTKLKRPVQKICVLPIDTGSTDVSS